MERSDTRILRRLWRFVRPHRGLIALGLVLLLLASACRLVLPLFVMAAIDDHLSPRGGADSQSGLTALCAAFAAVALLEFFLRRWQLLTVERAGQNALRDLRVDLFDHLQRLSARFFDRTPIGRLVGRVTTDVEALQELFSSGVVTVLGDLVYLIAILGILLSLSVPLTLVSMLVVPVLLVVTLKVRNIVRDAYREMRWRVSELNRSLHEQVAGMAVVQMFAQEDRSRRDFANHNERTREAQLTSVRWESILSAATEMLGSFTVALILWYGGDLALRGLGAAPVAGAGAAGALSLGTLFAFVDYMQKFFVPLNDLSLKYTVLQNAGVAAERIFALRDVDDVTVEPEEPVRLDAVRGRIEFEDVTFGYDPERPVLRGLDLRIEPGERVAIVGATGAGKTTILSLLSRLYDVQGGRILLDGVDIRELSTADLRTHVGMVPQDSFLFEGDILDNVRRGRLGATDAEARAVAGELHLDEVVARFPHGYHEPVRERGVNLSAGERQLVAFARVMLASPEVLVLDEATSSVDSHTEHLLQEATHRLTEGRTSLVIAHRLSTVREADRIVVLQRGEVIEQGSHDELMAAGGRYRQLYELQFDDVAPP